MSEKSVFRRASSPEMMLQSFPVFCFWSRSFVSAGREIWRFWFIKTQGRKITIETFFAILISTLRRFYRAKKKICHIHFKIDQLEGIPGPFVKFAHRCSFSFSHHASPRLLFHQLFLALHLNWMNAWKRLNITLYLVQVVMHLYQIWKSGHTSGQYLQTDYL